MRPPLENQGWRRHWSADGRRVGFPLSIDRSRSLHAIDTLVHVLSIKASVVPIKDLLLSRSSSVVEPTTKGVPVTRPKNTLPTLKMSDFKVNEGLVPGDPCSSAQRR